MRLIESHNLERLSHRHAPDPIGWIVLADSQVGFLFKCYARDKTSQLTNGKVVL